jgi:hypothetical protein
MSVYDTLDSLLRVHLDDRVNSASESERNNAWTLFVKKCRKNNIDPEEYKSTFINRNYKSSGSNRSKNTKSNPAWEDIKNSWQQYAEEKRKKEEERKRQQKRDEEIRRKVEQEMKRKNKLPHNSMTNVRYKVEKSKYSFAYMIDADCEILHMRFVLFSDEFEFPRRYRDMTFIYETDGTIFYGNRVKIVTLYLYENGLKIKIFDAREESEKKRKKTAIEKQYEVRLKLSEYWDLWKEDKNKIILSKKSELIKELSNDPTIKKDEIQVVDQKTIWYMKNAYIYIKFTVLIQKYDF